MAKTEIILIRHGETVWNLTRRYQGQLDSPLTPRGRQQVKAVGARLTTLPFAAIYSSDLGRAWRTAVAIGDVCGQAPTADPRLRERHFGILHGLTRKQMRARFPSLYGHHRKTDPDFAPPGGESLDALRQRTTACLEEITARHAGACLVFVSHGGALAALLKYVLGLPPAGPRPFRLVNCALNRVTHDGAEWQLECLGDTTHLSDDGLDDVD
jgi:2,3-bisphosphoglycerate-dependent phosphoglycerate mutase